MTLLILYFALSLLGFVIGLAKNLVKLTIFAALMMAVAGLGFGGLVVLLGCM